MSRRTRPIWPFGLALFLAGPAAWAEPVDDATRAAARNLGDSGVAAYQAGDYALASEKLEKAYHLLHAPSLGLWSGRSLAQRGLWVEAAERYLEVTRLAVLEGEIATQRQAQVDAQAELEAIRSKIPSVVIDLEGAAAHDVKVHLDGAPIASDLIGEARPANPGRHELTGLRGSERVVLQLSLREGERKVASLHFTGRNVIAPAAPVYGAPPPENRLPPSAQTSASAGPTAADRPPGSDARTFGWIALGVGGAGLVAGGVVGGMLIGAKQSLNDCQDVHCSISDRAAVDRYNTLRPLASVLLIGGGVVATAGAVILLTVSPNSPTAPRAALVLSPTSGYVAGTF